MAESDKINPSEAVILQPVERDRLAINRKGLNNMSRLFKVLLGLAALAASAGAPWAIWPPK